MFFVYFQIHNPFKQNHQDSFMLISQQKITPRITDLLAVFRKQSQIVSPNTIRKYIPNQHLYWTGSGREALKQILLNVREKGSRVGMPAFTCHVVLDAVKRADCQPVFYDSGVVAEIKDINKIIKEVDVLLVCHNFGFLPEIDKIADLCKKHQVILIEDCAQALGATYQNKLAGSFGDYAFYSFGISKNIGFCGGLIGSKEKLKLNGLKKFPLSKLIKVTGEVILSQLFFNKHLYHFTRKLLKKELIKEQESLNYKLPNFAKKIVLNQFKRYNKIIKKRKGNGDYCLKELKGSIEFTEPTKENNPAWLYFTLFTNNKEQLIHKLLKAGVELGEMKTFQCLSEKSIKAKEVEDKHLTFALYQSKKEIKFIVEKIQQAANE